MNPFSELIAEFKVTQYNNAEFGQVGDVTITTKSGGNSFYGSAFEYFQNSARATSPICPAAPRLIPPPTSLS